METRVAKFEEDTDLTTPDVSERIFTCDFVGATDMKAYCYKTQIGKYEQELVDSVLVTWYGGNGDRWVAPFNFGTTCDVFAMDVLYAAGKITVTFPIKAECVPREMIDAVRTC